MTDLHSVKAANTSLEALQKAIEDTEGTLRTVEREMALDDFDATEDARARISEARKFLRWAAGSIEAGREQS